MFSPLPGVPGAASSPGLELPEGFAGRGSFGSGMAVPLLFVIERGSDETPTERGGRSPDGRAHPSAGQAACGLMESSASSERISSVFSSSTRVS
jgi:hypothetical protein